MISDPFLQSPHVHAHRHTLKPIYIKILEKLENMFVKGDLADICLLY